LPSQNANSPKLEVEKYSSAAAASTQKKEAAIIYFGNVGAENYDSKEEALQGRRPWSMVAARGARSYIKKHVLDFNEARGWTFDTFVHSWNSELQEQLLELLEPTSASVGVELLRGVSRTSGMAPSIDIALKLMKDHISQIRGGKAYDRVLLLRFDSIFYSGFDMDALVEEDALYVASWCKTDFGRPWPKEQWPQGVISCWGMISYWADLEGVPDFWFAGGQSAVQKTFENLQEDVESGAVVKGRTCNGCGHGLVWGALNGHKVKTRRYRFHQIDNDLFRESECGEKWENYTHLGGKGSDWFAPQEVRLSFREPCTSTLKNLTHSITPPPTHTQHTHQSVTTSPDSSCGGMWCNVYDFERSHCATQKLDNDERDRTGRPPPPYPLGGPRTGG